MKLMASAGVGAAVTLIAVVVLFIVQKPAWDQSHADHERAVVDAELARSAARRGRTLTAIELKHLNTTYGVYEAVARDAGMNSRDSTSTILPGDGGSVEVVWRSRLSGDGARFRIDERSGAILSTTIEFSRH